MAVTTADGTLDWLVRSFANLGLSNYSKSQMGKTGIKRWRKKNPTELNRNLHKIYNKNSLSNDDEHFWFCLPKCCYLGIQAYYKVSIKSSMKWPIQTTLFIYCSWGLPLSRSILFFTFWVSQAFQQSTEPVHPHGAQQRPHKQARNKTGFVSWGEGGQGSQKKNSFTNFFPYGQLLKSQCFQL